MPHVILQPASSAGAQERFKSTVQNLVRLDRFQDLIPEALFAQLSALFPGGLVALWGVTAGDRDRNRRKYDRAAVGDPVLFSKRGGIFAAGVVAAKFENEAVAKALWGQHSNGESWRLMYALDEIRSVSIKYEDFNPLVGYSPSYVVQDFNVLPIVQFQTLIDRYSLQTNRHVTEVDSDSLSLAIEGLDGPMERQVSAWVRTEQSAARMHHLAGRAAADCRLCGRWFPAEFLVAAHKKKRSACTDSEKRDIGNVTMLCCLFGCDALYERGYVTVDPSGRIMKSELNRDQMADLCTQLLPALSEISPSEAMYFEWHAENTFIQPPS